MVKKAIEMTYTGFCDIYNFEKVLQEDKTTSTEEVLSFSDMKCKLSNKSLDKASESTTATSKTKSIVLFLSPDIDVKAGSKIVVRQNGYTGVYKNSGEPSVYPNHQEINLELFEGWA